MSINDELGYIIGKKIAHIVTIDPRSAQTHSQLFLIFEDNTSMEIFGLDFHNSSYERDKGYDKILKYTKLCDGKVSTYGKISTPSYIDK